jgi:hypothetical protein
MVTTDLECVSAVLPIGSQVYEYLGARFIGVNHFSSFQLGDCIVCSNINLVWNRTQGQEIVALKLPLVQSRGRRLDRAALPLMSAG